MAHVAFGALNALLAKVRSTRKTWIKSATSASFEAEYLEVKLLFNALRKGSAGSIDEECKGLRALVGQLMIAQDEERLELARNLHDDATQRLAFLQFEAQRLQQHALSTEVRAGLERIGKEISELATGLRNLSQQLYPAAIEHLGLPSALRVLSDQFRAKGLEMILFVADLDDSPSIAAALAFYRIAENALGNTLKHAPGATASLRLREVAGELELSIEDDGPGFDTLFAEPNAGLGLFGMQERSFLVGGSFTVRSSPGTGTTIVVRVPLQTV